MNMRNITENINFFFSSLVRNFIGFFRRVNLRGSLSNSGDLTGLLPIIGYGIVIMSFIDFIYIIFPLQLQNPEWEINTITALSNNCWVFMIGLGFIFIRYFDENQEDIHFPEIVFLRIMRWLLLMMAIAFLVVIPLVLFDTQRLLKLVNNEITQQQNGKIQQISQLETGLASKVNSAQLQALGKSLNLSPEELNLPDAQIKNAVKQNLALTKKRITQEAAQSQRQQWKSKWRNSSKTIIALIILSFTFVVVWFKIGQVF
jgi:hypothetical protein